jgi:flagellar biosynthesis protein FliP
MSLVLLPAFLLSEIKPTLLFGFTLLLCELLAFGLVLLLHQFQCLLRLCPDA